MFKFKSSVCVCSHVLPSRRGGVGDKKQHRGRAPVLGFASCRPLCRLQPVKAIVQAFPIPQQGMVKCAHASVLFHVSDTLESMWGHC